MSGEGQGMTDKAPDAFRTISEVADDLDLPQHVLRFWETRFPQIKPLKRGGGRRYYRPDDVLLLRGIRHLLYGEGYTIKGVQRILKESGVKAVQAAWNGELEDEGLPLPAASVAPSGDQFEDEADDAAPAGSFGDDDMPDAHPHGLAASQPDIEDIAAEDSLEAMPGEALPHPEAPAPALATEQDKQAPDEQPAAGAQPDLPAPRAPASAHGHEQRYVPNANVSIVRGGLPKPHREGAPVALDRRTDAGAPRFSPEDVQTLKGVLFELIETRKTLDLAVNRH
jgi:DNA-binding transcriptional MerR regulator